jgi:outer membrane murein-binding lipoprotein Lpp
VPTQTVSIAASADDGRTERSGATYPPTGTLVSGTAETARADDLLAQLRGLRAKVVSLLYKAEQAGELRTAVAAAKEARQNLETLARVRGELDDRPVVNILIAPEWLELRALIVAALEPHREARDALVRALEDAGSGRKSSWRDRRQFSQAFMAA